MMKVTVCRWHSPLQDSNNIIILMSSCIQRRASSMASSKIGKHLSLKSSGIKYAREYGTEIIAITGQKKCRMAKTCVRMLLVIPVVNLSQLEIDLVVLGMSQTGLLEGRVLGVVEMGKREIEVDERGRVITRTRKPLALHQGRAESYRRTYRH